jgi:hypothetical protein
MAFSAEDFDRLQNLKIRDFLNVVNAWVSWKPMSND